MPVIFEIIFSGSNQFFFLNSIDYSAYPEEEEVLLQEGIKYKVLKLDELEYEYDDNGKESSITIKVVKLTNIPEKYSQMNWFKRYFRYVFGWKDTHHIRRKCFRA